LTKNRLHFEKLLSFLQGASWALALAGSSYTFLLFFPFGILISSVIALFCFLVGFFFVVMFELAHIQIEKLVELKQQTELLKRIASHV
jgi:hypothetical protein